MKKNIIITSISTFLIAIALIASLFFDEVIGGRISQIITLTTALIGAAALFVQFVRDKKINEASFITNFSTTFYDPIDLGRIMNKIDSTNISGKQQITKEDYNDIVTYLQWCETLASLVLENVISIKSINALFAYRFFLITNNETVQKMEIVPNKEYYQEIYLLHGEKMINYSTALSKTEGYKEFINQISHRK